MKLKKTIIISAFPCCGKTYATEKLNQMGFKVLDSDSSEYSWMHKGIDYDSQGKVIYEKERNPEFPKNYIRHIKENIGKADIIFVSSHKVVRDALKQAKIHFICIFPPSDAMEQWVGKAFLRGSDSEFCYMLARNWISWFNEICQEKKECNEYMEVNFLNKEVSTLYKYMVMFLRNNHL